MERLSEVVIFPTKFTHPIPLTDVMSVCSPSKSFQRLECNSLVLAKLTIDYSVNE